MSGIPSQNGQYYQQQPVSANPAPTNNLQVAPPQQQYQQPGPGQFPQQPQAPQYAMQQQPQNWFQPQNGQAQQAPPQAPMMPVLNPNPNMPAQQPAAPQQQAPQQQSASPYESVYQDLARATGQPVETFRNHFKDNPNVVSSVIIEALEKIRTPQAPAQQQQNQLPQQPQVPVGKVEIPDSVKPYLRVNANGAVEAVDPAYNQWAAAANHNNIIAKNVAQKFMDDPTSILKEPQFQQHIQQQIEQQVQARVQVQQLESLRQSVKDKYAREIAQHDQNGQMLMSPFEQNKPMLTPLGSVFIAKSNELAALGMRESQKLYDMAMDQARKELGLTSQPQQQMPPQMSQMPNLWGQQQGQSNFPQANMYQPPFSGTPPQMMPQMQPPPSFPDLTQQQHNANSYWPGQPPSRQPQMPSNLSVEAALSMAMKDMPEGLGMDQYLQALGPLF